MARKQNGFGNSKSLAFKGVKSPGNRIDKVPKVKAAGSYPSDRRFGSTVSRTVIERYDAESDWIRWRKGYEYYVKAAFEDLETATPVCGSPGAELADVCYNPGLPVQSDPAKPNYNPQYILYEQDATLYGDTNFSIDIKLSGWHFSTLNSDTGNHYCIKRTLETPVNMFNVTEVLYTSEAKANNELWVKGTTGPDAALLLRSLGERVTDGETNNSNGEPVELRGKSTEATLTYALNDKQQPAIYTGKSTYENPTTVSVVVNLDDLKTYTEANGFNFYEANGENLNKYIGKIGYFPQFYNVQTYSAASDNYLIFKDGSYFFEVDLSENVFSDDANPKQAFYILERETILPPSLYDVTAADPIFATQRYASSVKGKYLFQKSDYQRFFGNTYLTGELVEQQINRTSFPILPFIIQSVNVHLGKVTFTAEPFVSTLQLEDLPPYEGPGYLVFAAYSFTQTQLDTDAFGDYYHRIEGPYNNVYEQAVGDTEFSKLVWYRKTNDIDPYDLPFVEVFTNSTVGLRPATIYGCSCPSYSSAQLRMPQTTQGPTERKINRQRNYPLPTALGRKDYESIGLDAAAGKVQSWQTKQQRASFNLCKHSICAMFSDHLKLQEPNTYQTIDAREQFGAKLAADIEEVGVEFQEAYRRGGITMLELVFAIGQSINYDDVELAYLVLNADEQFSANIELSATSAVAQRYNQLL